jgi:Lsr2
VEESLPACRSNCPTRAESRSICAVSSPISRYASASRAASSAAGRADSSSAEGKPGAAGTTGNHHYPGPPVNIRPRRVASHRRLPHPAPRQARSLISKRSSHSHVNSYEGTVRFGLDGTEYEIDLNAKHARQLRDTLARYAAAGRRLSASARRPARGGRKAQPNALNTTEVREWARAQGIDVKDRGRVPAELVVKFKAATGQ